jgi:hypothetical protein
VRSRRGVALVAALGLLMLGAALLAGSSLAALELRRGVRGRVAGARAEWEARRAVGMVVQGWDAELDSMPVGAMRQRAMQPLPDAPATLTVAYVRRLATDRYAATVSVRVGAEGGAGALANRRVRLLLERAHTSDSTAAPGDSLRAVMPIARWRVVDVW